MRQSNAYVLLFSGVMTIILGGALSLASVGLKPAQTKQIELDTKKKILGAVMDISNLETGEEVLALYDKRFKSVVVDINGNPVEKDAKGNPLVAEKIDIQKNHKVDKEVKNYPVFMFLDENDSSKVIAYVFPMFGSGLWDWISGYMALDGDLNTIKGVAFDHKSETPGLGARITTPEIQGRYVGKEIFENGDLVSVTMVKGESGKPQDAHHVDGMSGATLTGKGVNAMLENYLSSYTAFIKKQKSASGQSAMAF